jgi:hypothetical protein
VAARIEEIRFFFQSIKRTREEGLSSYEKREKELEEGRVHSRRRRANR